MSVLRAYLTMSVEQTQSIIKDGRTDIFEEFGMRGVYLSTRPLDIQNGFEGPMVLCLDVPVELFDQFDINDDVQEGNGYRMTLIPTSELNQLGKPQVYDHEYAGLSRRELVTAIRAWEQAEQTTCEQDVKEMSEPSLSLTP